MQQERPPLRRAFWRLRIGLHEQYAEWIDCECLAGFVKHSRYVPNNIGVAIMRAGDFVKPIRAIRLVLVSLAILFQTMRPNADRASAADLESLDVSKEGGICSETIELTMGCRIHGSAVYYTIDGRNPGPASGIRYEGPIRVANTKVFRVRAYNAGVPVSREASRTFVFASDVLRQTGRDFPATWGLRDGLPVLADYAMDPEIVDAPSTSRELAQSLKDLPVVAIVMDPDDLFGQQRGIYCHPMETGKPWERDAQIEFSNWPGVGYEKTPCSVRIQGGWNRRPEESPKHAFRLIFRESRGREGSRFNPFGGKERSFESLILRAGCNNSWLHWSAIERQRGDYIRDQWLRESYSEMGRPSARGLFVHLYLNGLYWGVYNLVERPDATFAASVFGGGSWEYEVRNADKILAGNDRVFRDIFRLANAGLASDIAYHRLGELVDLPAFVDFILVNLYGANGDWDRSSNWYAIRRTVDGGRYVFVVWDGERTLERLEDNTIDADDDFSPMRLFHRLRGNAEFVKLFRERARLHLTGDGVLTPRRAIARYRKWVEVLDRPILAESARWGDYRRDVHPYKEGPYEIYTRDSHWRPETRRLMDEYLPRRTAVFTEQLRSAGLYTE